MSIVNLHDPRALAQLPKSSPTEVIATLRAYALFAENNGQTVQAGRLRDLALRAETVLNLIEI